MDIDRNEIILLYRKYQQTSRRGEFVNEAQFRLEGYTEKELILIWEAFDMVVDLTACAPNSCDCLISDIQEAIAKAEKGGK